MNHRLWDPAQQAAPQQDQQYDNDPGEWQLDEANQEDTATLFTATNDSYDNALYATGGDEDEEKDEDNENEDDAAGDWGHVDPAETNSPFPDSNDPSGPGSAV